MNHEKIIKREDGSKVKIEVRFWILYSDKPMYDISISLCGINKRKFERIEFNSWEYSELSLEDRKNFEMTEYLKHVSEEEIIEAKKEMWEKLAP